MTVLQIQQALKAAGFDPGPLDGQMGPKTLAAIESFQKAKGLVVDGKVGPKTTAALKGGAPAAPAGAAPANATTAVGPDGLTIPQEASKLYGYLASYINDPQVGPILQQAAKEGWDINRLQGALYATSWWQTTQQSARTFDALQKTDPASAAAQVAAAQASAQALASSLGVSIDPSRLQQLATDSVRLGWNTDQLRQGIANEYHYDPTSAAGKAAASITQLKQMASDYAVPLSDASMQSWVQQIIGGQNTTDGFKSYLIDQAKSMYPTMSAALDSGQTVAQYFDPYKQVASQTLSLPPDSVSFTDPKWQSAIMQTDPKTGQRTPMAMDQFTQKLKSDPTYGYQYTQNGRTDAYGILAAIGQEMGKTA